MSGFEVGDSVRVSYTSTGTARTARAVTYTDARTADGTVIAVAQDGSAFTIQTSAGQRITFEPGQNLIMDRGALGGRVRVLYTIRAETRAAHTLTVLAAASLITVSGTVTAVAQDGSSFAIQSADGRTLTFSTGDEPELIGDYGVGDNVQVSYVQALSTNIAQDVEDAPPPETETASGTTTTNGTDGTPVPDQ